MPDNQIPATKNESPAAPDEFNFAQPTEENPRIKRRSLKAKPGGLIKPASPALASAREMEREAPPLSTEQAQAKPQVVQAAVVKSASSTVAPPRTTPTLTPTAATSQPVSSATSAKPATAAATPVSATTAPPKTALASASVASTAKPTTSSVTATTSSSPSIRSTATPTTSPHGTRPATLYYSSPTRKDTEAPSTPMKTIPTASSASSSSSSATATPNSTSRPATTSTSTARPSPSIDYRANVERQSREQKSVGSILSYIVYGLIAFFVISAGLAGYGAHIIFQQLNDQSVTVSDLDKKYADANKDLTAKLSATQDTLAAAQAQIAREQDLIVHQQEDLNKLLGTSTDNANAVKAEKATTAQQAQELAAIRERVRNLEYKTTIQKY